MKKCFASLPSFDYLIRVAVRDILSIPHPVLYRKSEPITEYNRDLRNLVRDMYDTMYEASGVGLAAVQIGVLKRLLVIDLSAVGFTKGVFINPEVVEQSEEMQLSDEGCLSVPGLSAPLERPVWVKVKYNDLSGKEQAIEAEMLMARALLHEMDHLDGKIFVDQLEPEIHRQVKNDIKRIRKGKPPKGGEIPPYRTIRAS